MLQEWAGLIDAKTVGEKWSPVNLPPNVPLLAADPALQLAIVEKAAGSNLAPDLILSMLLAQRLRTFSRAWN